MAVDAQVDATLMPSAMHDEALYKALLDHMHEGVYVVDRGRRIVYWNRAAEQITGYLEQDVVGRNCHANMLMHCDAEGRELCGDGCPLLAVMQDGVPRRERIFARHRHGHRVPVNVRAQAIRDRAGAIVGAIEVFEQPSHEARSELTVLPAHGCMDAQTGVASRMYTEMRAEQRLAQLDILGVPLGWIRIDLDNSEAIVQRYGTAALEAAVALVARTLHANAGALDVIGRWDGASFRVSVYNRTRGELLEMTRRLVALIRCSNFEWWGDTLSVTVSAGVAAVCERDSIHGLEGRVAAAVEECRAAGGGQAREAAGDCERV